MACREPSTSGMEQDCPMQARMSCWWGHRHCGVALPSIRQAGKGRVRRSSQGAVGLGGHGADAGDRTGAQRAEVLGARGEKGREEGEQQAEGHGREGAV